MSRSVTLPEDALDIISDVLVGYAVSNCRECALDILDALGFQCEHCSSLEIYESGLCLECWDAAAGSAALSERDVLAPAIEARSDAAPQSDAAEGESGGAEGRRPNPHGIAMNAHPHKLTRVLK